MLSKYIRAKWKKLISIYLILILIIFGFMSIIWSFSEPIYRSKFSLDAGNKYHHANEVIDKLLDSYKSNDTTFFAEKLNLSMDQVRAIVAIDQDLIKGDFIEVTMDVTDRKTIIPLYEGIVSYVQKDTLLNGEMIFARKKIAEEMKLLKIEMDQLSEKSDQIESTNWQINRGSTEPTPITSNSKTLTSIYLKNRYNSLSIQRNSLILVRPLSTPLVPQQPERTSLMVYFVFANIIVLGIIFLLVLIGSGREETA